MTLALGVDGCRGGWCCVAIDADDRSWKVVDTRVFAKFSQILATKASVICVDVPIGLLDRPGQRACDVEARKMLGWPRRTSVFSSPCRSVLSRDLSLRNHAVVSAANRHISGKGLSIQSFAIAPKIREVDDPLAKTRDLQGTASGVRRGVYEAHPELCFWALNAGVAVRFNKKTPEGQQERWDLLRSGKVLPDLPPQPKPLPWAKKHCAPDDYIDALVTAWTAVCILHHEARPVPDKPEVDDRDLRMEMWLPRGDWTSKSTRVQSAV
jgi:predicted RNase H-like nuclease